MNVVTSSDQAKQDVKFVALNKTSSFGSGQGGNRDVATSLIKRCSTSRAALRRTLFKVNFQPTDFNLFHFLEARFVSFYSECALLVFTTTLQSGCTFQHRSKAEEMAKEPRPNEEERGGEVYMNQQ